MTLKRLFCNGGLFYRDEIFISLSSKVSGRQSTKSCCLIVDIGIFQTFLSKYSFYFACYIVKVFSTSSCMAATWCKIFCRGTFKLVALTVSSGSMGGLTAVVGTCGCPDIFRRENDSLVERCI